MTALVTGAARGIGREYARQLGAMGYSLILVDKDRTVLDVAVGIEASGTPARAIVYDLACKDAADAIHEDVVSHGESWMSS